MIAKRPNRSYAITALLVSALMLLSASVWRVSRRRLGIEVSALHIPLSLL